MNQDHREISNPDSVADRECLFSERVRFRDTAINTTCNQHSESPLTPDLNLREFLHSAERSRNSYWGTDNCFLTTRLIEVIVVTALQAK